MCYQVVEKYSVCRCLFYKHAIDFCQAYGQRGHSVQEKTVLVGFACKQHIGKRSVGGFKAVSEDQDIVDVAVNSTDGADDGDSAFSTAITLKRATSQATRDYLGEVSEVICKNIHPPDLALAKLSLVEENVKRLREILERFLSALAKEAVLSNLSAPDRLGIKNLQSDTWQLTASVSTIWTSEVPLWQLYSPVPGQRNSGRSNFLSMETRGQKSENEIFEAFICSSSAFLDLAQSVARLSRNSGWKLRLSHFTAPFYYKGKSAISPSHLGKTAISFECSCGQTIIDDYTEVSPGGLRDKERQLRLLSVRQQFQHAASQNAKRGSMVSSFQNLLKSLTHPAASKNAQLPQHQTPQHQSGINQGKTCNTQTQSSGHVHNFIHWCIPSGRYATHMIPLQSCQINNDIDFFKALKERYNQSKRRYQALLSFKKPVALRFVKFRLYHRQLVDIHETDRIPPESHKHEYDYFPMPAETIPPIGPNLLMHFFMHPQEAAPQPVLLPCIPKRKNDGLEPCPIRGSSIGWGIDVITGVDELKLFVLGLLGSLMSVVFGIAWAFGRSDIQGGFAVVGFLFALSVLATASLKALDFQVFHILTLNHTSRRHKLDAHIFVKDITIVSLPLHYTKKGSV